MNVYRITIQNVFTGRSFIEDVKANTAWEAESAIMTDFRKDIWTISETVKVMVDGSTINANNAANKD